MSTDGTSVAAITTGSAESLLSKTGFSALAGLMAVVGRMVASIAAARMLGPEGAGELAYLLWVAEALAIVSGLGLPAAATRFVAHLRAQKKGQETSVVRWSYVLYVTLTLAGSAVGVMIATHTSAGRQSTVIGWCFGAYFLLFAVGTFHLAYLAGLQDFRRIARINAASTLLLVITVLVLTPLWGLPGALLGYLAGTVPSAAVRIRVLREEPSVLPPACELDWRVFRYALYAWYGAIMAAFTWSRAELFFVERYWGADEVAMFTVGISLSSLATQGPTLLVGALLAHFAQLRGADDVAEIKRLFVSGTRLMALLLFPLCFGLASITPVLLPLVYGEAFARAVPNAVILIASSVVVISTVSTSLLYAMEKANVIAMMSTAGAGATILGGLIVVSRYGAWGAAWSRFAVQTTMVAVTLVYIAWRLRIPAPLADLLKTLFAAAISAASSAFLVWRIGTMAAVVCGVPLAAFVYLLLVRFLRVLQPDDLGALGKILTRIPRRLRPHADTMLQWLTPS
jgi:O-antigen/teichoic acid export membrane protein